MKHKITLTILSVLVSINLLNAQDINTEQVFSNMHGIKQEEDIFYEVEGYSIFVKVHKASFDDKGINKIKKKYPIQRDIIATTDTAFQTNKMFVMSQSRATIVTESSIYYLFPKEQNEIKVIGLITVNKRDIALEKLLIQSILDNSIPDEVYTSMTVDSVRFAGRSIVLGPVCHWMGTHNIQCPNLGQMNWAEFRNLEKAKERIEAQYDITASQPLGEVLQQDTINIIFEGSETKAIKTKYKIQISKLIMGGSNILIIYYVATKVRDKYIACVLSHYTDDVNAENLPPLLSEVMQLKE